MSISRETLQHRKETLVAELKKGVSVETELLKQLATVRDQIKRIDGARAVLDELINSLVENTEHSPE